MPVHKFYLFECYGLNSNLNLNSNSFELRGKRKEKEKGKKKTQVQPTSPCGPLSLSPCLQPTSSPLGPPARSGPASSRSPASRSARAARVRPRTPPAGPNRQPTRRLAPLQPLARLPASASPRPTDSVARSSALQPDPSARTPFPVSA